MAKKILGIFILICLVTLNTATAEELSLKEIIKIFKKTIVKIKCDDIDSVGTGFLISKDGYILTCHHVVSKLDLSKQSLNITYSNNIKVIFNDGTTKKSTLLTPTNLTIDRDPLVYDYAILKIDGNNHEFLELGSYSSADEGDEIFFGGYPFGSDHHATHSGFISAKYSRDGIIKNTTQNILQVDASINKGNSGGPLFLKRTGEVVGIISTREGRITQGLAEVREYIIQTKTKGSGGVFIQGVDPLPIMVDLINTIDRNISTGIGHAIAVNYSAEAYKKLRKTP